MKVNEKIIFYPNMPWRNLFGTENALDEKLELFVCHHLCGCFIHQFLGFAQESLKTGKLSQDSLRRFYERNTHSHTSSSWTRYWIKQFKTGIS